ALNPLMTVGDQVAEVLQLKQSLSLAQAGKQAVELLATTGIPEPERRARSFAHQLSGGQRQRAMIAMALASAPKLLLADEPTTALDVTLRVQILELLGELQRQTGMALLLITHDLNLVRRFADRAAVMERGLLVEQGPVHEVFAHPQHAYTRRLIGSVPQRDVVESPPRADKLLVETQQLQVRYATPLPGLRGWFRKGEFVAVKGVDLRLLPHHTLGIVGESGSGKSTLAQAILGLLPSDGQLRINGQAWHLPATRNSPANQSLRRSVQVVFQDPFSSLSPRLTVEEIVGEGLRVHAATGVVVDHRQRVEQALADVGLTELQYPGLLQRYPHEFSGGQRQRIAIARCLTMQPEILVCDESVSALDVSVQAQVLNLMRDLQDEFGLTYLLISHNLAVIRHMCDEVIVLYQGQIVERGTPQKLFSAPEHPYTQALVKAAPRLPAQYR
ncbi:MAG: dipeptide ABC transporter ATP-binding protein, partial [Comamonas sp.]